MDRDLFDDEDVIQEADEISGDDDLDQELSSDDEIEGLEMSADAEADAASSLDPEVSEEEIMAQEEMEMAPEVEVSGSELEGFESAEIEDVIFIDDEQLVSIIESMLFATDRPVSLALMKQAFKGTNVKTKNIKSALDTLASDYANRMRGFTLEEVSGGYQLRSKVDNVSFLRQSVKARPFKLSGPALEVLSIVAYKQPITKAQIDEIRGVESGHLLRALMEKSLVCFGEKSELPGKPMLYESTKKFLEIFGLRNINELPSLHEIDQLIPEGIGEEEEKETLGDLTEGLSQQVGSTYSEGEDELMKITDQLTQITTTTDFFEQEKERQRLQKEKERAQDIRDAIALGEVVEKKDLTWLERFDERLRSAEASQSEVDEILEAAGVSEVKHLELSPEIEAEVQASEGFSAHEGEDVFQELDLDTSSSDESANEPIMDASEADNVDLDVEEAHETPRTASVSSLSAQAAAFINDFDEQTDLEEAFDSVEPSKDEEADL